MVRWDGLDRQLIMFGQFHDDGPQSCKTWRLNPPRQRVAMAKRDETLNTPLQPLIGIWAVI